MEVNISIYWTCLRGVGLFQGHLGGCDVSVVTCGNSTHLKSNGQSFVAPPVCGQHGAQEVGAVRLHQLTWMIRDHLWRHHRRHSSFAEAHYWMNGEIRAEGSYLHHAAVSQAQFAHQSGPASGLLRAQGQGLSHLSPRSEGGGWGSVTPAGGWVSKRTDEETLIILPLMLLISPDVKRERKHNINLNMSIFSIKMIMWSVIRTLPI